MFRAFRVALRVGLFAAALPRLALAHGGNGGLADFIADWLPFLVVIFGLGTYGVIRMVGRKPAEPADEGADEGLPVEGQTE